MEQTEVITLQVCTKLNYQFSLVHGSIPRVHIWYSYVKKFSTSALHHARLLPNGSEFVSLMKLTQPETTAKKRWS